MPQAVVDWWRSIYNEERPLISLPTVRRRLGENRNYVLVMVEDRGKSCGRLRLDATGDLLQTVVESRVEKGATAHTDGLAGYSGLKDAGFKHKTEVIGDSKRASKRFPKVHRVASLLKRVILGNVAGPDQPRLLAEFEFRFNRRRSEKRPLLFARVIEFGLQVRGKTRRYFTDKGTMFHQMGLT